MKNIVRTIIFGCGGHARSVANILYENNKDIEILFVDDNAQKDEKILGYQVKSRYDLRNDDNYIVAIGDNVKRQKIFDYLFEQRTGNCISVISKSSNIGIDSKIGKGTFIAANTYLGPQAKIKNNSIINTGSIVEHEVIIGNHTHIAPHTTICGRSAVGNYVMCGAGSTIIDKVKICDYVVIGAGAVVTDDITKPGIYVGIPARKIKEV